MRTYDHYVRVACSLVWADRRVGESYREAAERAATIINESRADTADAVDADTVLGWACIEKADRMMVNKFMAAQSLRGGKSSIVHINPKEHEATLLELRAQVGLDVKQLTDTAE